MKHIIALTLFVSMLSACAPLFMEIQASHPAEIQPVSAALQTQTPATVSMNSATPTHFFGEVSIEHAQIIYYDITGSTAGELRAAMDELGPQDAADGNQGMDASTDWYISWDWPGYGTDNCDLSAATVTYDIKVTLPRWEPSPETPPELIAKWEEYIQNLTRHEQAHVDIVNGNYLSVQLAIQNSTCSTAEQAAQETVETIRKLNSTYDRATKHGETQGAVFP